MGAIGTSSRGLAGASHALPQADESDYPDDGVHTGECERRGGTGLGFHDRGEHAEANFHVALSAAIPRHPAWGLALSNPRASLRSPSPNREALSSQLPLEHTLSYFP